MNEIIRAGGIALLLSFMQRKATQPASLCLPTEPLMETSLTAAEPQVNSVAVLLWHRAYLARFFRQTKSSRMPGIGKGPVQGKTRISMHCACYESRNVAFECMAPKDQPCVAYFLLSANTLDDWDPQYGDFRIEEAQHEISFCSWLFALFRNVDDGVGRNHLARGGKTHRP